MYNIYRRISNKSFNGTKVLYRKAKINCYELNTFEVGEYFKSITKSITDKYNVRTMFTTAFCVSISVLTEDNKNIIFEYWAEATK